MNTLLLITATLCAILVESFSGQVSIKSRDSEQWVTPTKHYVLDRRDSLYVQQGAKLVIIDDVTGRAYTLNSTGMDNVNQSLSHAKASDMTTLFSMTQQMKKNAFGQNQPAHNKPIYGGATRAEDEEQKIDSIACSFLAVAKQNTIAIPGLRLRTVERKELISFAIDNNSNEAYYVNILAVNTSADKVSLCIVPSPDVDADVLLLAPNQTMDLSMFQFVQSSNIHYVLVASKLPYIPIEIDQLLKYPDDLKCNK